MIDLSNDDYLNVDITSREQIVIYSHDILIRFNFPLDVVQPTKYMVDNFTELLENYMKISKESQDY